MNLSAPFIRRPVATALLALALFIAGTVAFFQLPTAALPKVDFPTLAITSALPGASAETMAALVAAPLERRLGRIAGLTEMTSTSSTGTATVTLQFELDRDLDGAARDVQAAINAAAPELPAQMPSRPRIIKVNPTDVPVIVLAMTSQTLPTDHLYDVANSVVNQKLAQLPGVGSIYIGGGQMPAVRIQVDPDKLAGLGLALSDVRQLITETTLNIPKGTLQGEQRAPAHNLAANDQLLRAADYEPLVLSSTGDSVIRLRDIARVLDDVETRQVAGWFDGRRALLLAIRRQPGANIIEVIDRVKATLPELSRSVSPAIQFEVALDRSLTIRASVREIEWAMLLSVGLVVLVVFLFLRNVRSTLIPSVAVPLSIVGTFAGMYLCGFSLNNLSLMALTVGTGIVVDDAIVVTENISRRMESGMRAHEAAMQGARQIGFTVLAITLSLLAVFIPIVLMKGIPGRLCREFVITLGMAVALSALISLTLTPMMCAHLLKEPGDTPPSWPARWLERLWTRLQHAYERSLAASLRHPRWMLAVTLCSLAASVYLYIIPPKGLFPQQDTGRLIGVVEAAQDVSFLAMKEGQLRANQILDSDPDVEHYLSFAGVGPGTTANTGVLYIALKPIGIRRSSAEEVIARIRQKSAKLEGIKLYLQAEQDIRIGARFARAQFQYTLQASDLTALNTWAPRVLQRFRSLKELRDVASDQQIAALALNVTVDRDTASRMGIRFSDIDDALYDALGQRQVAVNYTQRNQYRVVLEMLPELQQGSDAIRHVYVRSAGGSVVPLHAMAQAAVAATPLSIPHQGQFPAVTLSFNTAPGVGLNQAMAAIERAEQDLHMPDTVRASFQGTAQAFGESLSNMPLLILAALVTIYLVLGILFESYVHQVTILSTLPSAGIGALLALMLYKLEFNVIALIGVILLIGIVIKNAIMIIDLALETEQAEGLSPTDSIYQACAVRFRPILMTTLAALLGALPLMLGHGAGAELRHPLGISIVGGLVMSQVLTLFTTPVVYLALTGWRRRSPA